MTIAIIQALVLAFAFVVILMPTYLRLLRAVGMGKRIRVEDGPGGHEAKEGTPTMGGLIIIMAITVSVLLWADLINKYILLTMAAFLWLGAVGFADDYIKIIKKAGLVLIKVNTI